MSVLTASAVYNLARGAGLGHEAAIIATAIAKGESGWNTEAVGDTTLQDATWGPSIGLWQVRSVKAETGTGKTRDASQLKSPTFNARSMVAISSGGSNWQPWSVYTNGSYRAHLDEVRRAVGSGSGGGVVAPNVPYTGPEGDYTPQPSGTGSAPINGGGLGQVGDVVGGVASGIVGGVGNAAGDLATNIVTALVKSVTPAILIGTGVLAGGAIIAVGLWRGSESRERASS